MYHIKNTKTRETIYAGFTTANDKGKYTYLYLYILYVVHEPESMPDKGLIEECLWVVFGICTRSGSVAH